MSETVLQKVQNEAKAFLYAPIYPFLQRDWPAKMWIFVALSYVPILNVIIARGWRMEYIRRLGWREERPLPSPRDMATFLVNGLKLWLATGAFLLVPLLIIMAFGLGGVFDLVNDIMSVIGLLLSFFLGAMPVGEFLSSLWSLVVNELIATALIFLIENIWLLIYIPVYRVGMIRFALTGKLLQSHFAVVKNLTFIRRNFVDILLMYSFNVFNFALFLAVSTLLTLTVVGVSLIPIVTFFMPYWNSGYEYGLLARIMVEQEGLARQPAPAPAPQPAFAAAAPLPTPAPLPAVGPLASPGAATLLLTADAVAAVGQAMADAAADVANPPEGAEAAPAEEAAPARHDLAVAAARSCAACGAQLETIYRFCTSCGSPAEGRAEAAA